MVKAKNNYYSKFVILVFIEPSEQFLQPAYNVILENVKLKWQKNHDPTMDPSRFSIIFVTRDDVDTMYDRTTREKFSPLNNVDHKSRIYVIGHSASGSDEIWSNPIETQDKPGLVTTNRFTYQEIGLLIAENIHQNKHGKPQVVMPRPYRMSEDDAAMSLGRRLKICLTPCNTGNDRVLPNGVIEKSFAEKFFNFVVNKMGDKWVNCDVVATKGYLFPMPTNPNMLDLLKMLSLAYSPTTTAAKGFHKRYGLVEGNLLSTLFPRHRSTNIDYKIMFVVDPATTLEQINGSNIQSLKLAGPAMRARFPNQEMAEYIYDDCLRIGLDEKNVSLEFRNRAIFITKGILTGEMPDAGVRNAYEGLLKDMDVALRSPLRKT